MITKIIFLDRDGVINKKASPHEYINSWKKFEFLDGSKESIKKLVDNGYKIFIVTNQRGVSKGKMSLNALYEIHSNMVKEIEEAGGKIAKIYFCPHDYNECNCRKPLPGMLDKAKEEFNMNLEECWIVGDSDIDIEMGKSRNCKTIYIGDDYYNADYKVANLNEAAELIIGS